MTVIPPAPGATVTNTMYQYNRFQLSDFPRAVNVAQAYQHFRITGITLTFKPAYDTFSSALGAAQKMNLYYMIDKADAIPTTVTLEGLKQMGVKPISFDEKPLRITWRPSVLTEDQNTALAGIGGAYKVSPWLTTNANPGAPGLWLPSNVAHKGIYWYIEQPGANTTIYVEVELQFQYKKPLVQLLSGPSAVQGQYPALDYSPDGVVGGTDGRTQLSPSE